MKRGWIAGLCLALGSGACADKDTRPDDVPPTLGTDGLTSDGGDTDDQDGADTDGGADVETTGGQPGAVDTPMAAAGVWITDVEANQGVGVRVATQGQPIQLAGRNAELIHGRITLIRAAWAVQMGLPAREIEAHLVVSYPDGTSETFVDSKMVTGPADPLSDDGMFAWELPAEAVRPSMTYRIELLENSATVIDASTDGATFPVAGPSDLGITADAMKMKVVLIPVVTPEGGVQMTDPLRQIFEERLIATYPLQELEIVVREPWVNSARLSNLDAAFNFMAQARAEDGAGHETYYHLVADNDTCCTGADFEGWAGIANLSDASNLAERDGISKIYVDWPEYWEVDAEVMIHEIGHNHGRDHAPCGDPGGPDPDYPYAGAVIGVTGYDIHKGTLMYAGVPDAEYGMELTDFMSYCWPNWWSDYTWQALVERVRLMTQAASAGAPAPWNREILRGVVHADGTVTWSRVPARGGEATAAVQTVADGVMTMRGADGGALAEAAVFARPLADTDVTILEADVTAAPPFDRFEVDLVVGRHVEAYAAAITTVSAVARR